MDIRYVYCAEYHSGSELINFCKVCADRRTKLTMFCLVIKVNWSENGLGPTVILYTDITNFSYYRIYKLSKINAMFGIAIAKSGISNYGQWNITKTSQQTNSKQVELPGRS